ncbi:hypothetical protein [Chitinolyticbacter albus]|uniref:hypothetical protein n=1 Tax=Chitinolyticbacter albus TaxID=2961951 RepID=UPI00210C8628|nr:hypothetical protein [Chitinolyticbacter albus]
MRNRLRLAIVLIYYAHCIAAVAYAATIADPKGQAVRLSAPLWLTPSCLLDLMPTVPGIKSNETWQLQTLVQLPMAFTFSSVVLYAADTLLQKIWVIDWRSATAVGLFLGLLLGGLWFFVTHGNHLIWLTLSLLGGLASATFYAKLLGR